jgi:CRISPR-associated protein Cas2
MWVFVMFDLPTETKAERRAASGFRHGLLDLGFEMAQFSVYVRFCANSESVATYVKQIEGMLPEGGKVSILQFTDKQYARIISYTGRKQLKLKTAPNQFDLF